MSEIVSIARSKRLRDRRDQLQRQFLAAIAEDGTNNATFGMAWEFALLEEKAERLGRRYGDMLKKYEPADEAEDKADRAQV